MSVWPDRGTVVYLSGGMSGYEGWNIPAFDKAAKVLRGRGMTVLSPPELTHAAGLVDGEDEYRQFMVVDLIALVQKAEAIVLLPGWQGSRGAKAELVVAMVLDLPVYTYDAEQQEVRRAVSSLAKVVPE